MQTLFKKIAVIVFSFLFALLSSASVFSAELIPDQHEIMKAKVEEVLLNKNSDFAVKKDSFSVQTLKVIPLEGSLEGKSLEIINDYIPLKEGDVFFLTKTIYGDSGQEVLSVGDVYRLNKVFFFLILFVVIVIIFGGAQGARGLLSLLGSFFVIMYVLLPGIFNGLPPILLSVGVASVIIVFGSYITHGFNKTTSSAVVGMILTVVLIGFFAWFSVDFLNLTGLENEESVYLNFNTGGKINFSGLLLGGIIIGLLGVLYDAAIGQAVAVEELFRASEHMDKKKVFRRATRIGREHIGALVNTLAIAYVGTSLPILLLFFGSSMPVGFILNKELFVTEILRTIIGSIGLVLAVPITTLISVVMLQSYRGKGESHGGGHSHHSHTHFS